MARATHLLRASLVFDNMLDATAYIVVCVGGLVALLQAAPGSAAGIALVIGGTLAWLLLFRVFSSHTLTINQASLMHLTMIALTFLVLSATWLGAGFDWLLPLATLALLPFRLPLARAILFALLVLAGTVAVLALLELPSGPNQFFFNLSTLTPAFLFCFLFPLAVRREGIERARAEALVAELEAAQRQLRAYAAESEELAISRERNRMAREIHDTLGHYLTILAVQLETALKMEELGDARLHAELVEARRAAAECLTEVRRSVAALRPADLTTLSLPDALARLVSEYEALDPTIEIALDIEGSADGLDLEQRLALYRCAQEALTNVRKHSGASRALLRLRVDESKAEFLALDNGRGASSDSEKAPGFGLLGIRERIALLGGKSSMGPEQGKGWRVQVTLPIQQHAPDPESAVKTGDAGMVERGHATSAIG
ncbi:MAG TPA: sensor histidine kinase [Ktedonobacterales bacterium]|jgi:signal transduction histidine kinase